jgi:benzoyl-CoA 2,3-dioxygenase component B
VIEQAGFPFRFKIPSRRFNRNIGIYSGMYFTPEGELISSEEWEKHKNDWLPSDEDREYVRSLMKAVYEVGKIANWIAPPDKGVNQKPFAFEYVRFE